MSWKHSLPGVQFEFPSGAWLERSPPPKRIIPSSPDLFSFQSRNGLLFLSMVRLAQMRLHVLVTEDLNDGES